MNNIAIAKGCIEDARIILEEAHYGSDEGPASELFDQEDAEGALKDARLVISFVDDILRRVTYL